MKNAYKVNEEAVKKIAERVYDNGSTVINRNDLEEMFPELKGSENDRIRKALREIIIRYDPNNKTLIKEVGISQKEFLAWIEKQVEQNHAWSEEDEKIYQSIMDDTVQENQLDSKQIEWLKSLKGKYS